MNKRGKLISSGRKYGRTKNIKKAVVTLRKGDSIKALTDAIQFDFGFGEEGPTQKDLLGLGRFVQGDESLMDEKEIEKKTFYNAGLFMQD